VRNRGKSITDIRTILITHHHPDRVGALAGLRERSGATVYAHAADAPVITGAFARATPTGGLRVRMAAKLAGFGFAHAVFGHGPAVSGDAAGRFRAHATD
jgi:glyoxylase-like metal-dependent hydrolase (beta-lactamase superfamily II)